MAEKYTLIHVVSKGRLKVTSLSSGDMHWHADELTLAPWDVRMEERYLAKGHPMCLNSKQ